MSAWRFLDWTTRRAHVAVQFQFEPRDCWVGVFWRFRRSAGEHTGWNRHHGAFSAAPWSLHADICLLPMLPLHVYIMRTVRP